MAHSVTPTRIITARMALLVKFVLWWDALECSGSRVPRTLNAPTIAAVTVQARPGTTQSVDVNHKNIIFADGRLLPRHSKVVALLTSVSSVLQASVYQRDPFAIWTAHFPSAFSDGIDSNRVQAATILNQPTCRFIISRCDFWRRILR